MLLARYGQQHSFYKNMQHGIDKRKHIVYNNITYQF